LQVRESFGDRAIWVLEAAISLVAAIAGAAACRIAIGRVEPEAASATA
jgi:hypothetical protein